jgi:hypothetical protein
VRDLEESGCPVFSSNRLGASDCTGNEMSLAANTTCHYKSLNFKGVSQQSAVENIWTISQMK